MKSPGLAGSSLLKKPEAFSRYIAPLHKTEWVVYSKPPFGGPEQVLAYLGRYTHRVAISSHRLVSIDDDKVSFRWKDYRRTNRKKTMTLNANEFIRRFLLHVLPRGFQRIRHFGFLGNCVRKAKLALCRELLDCNTQSEQSTDSIDYRDRYEKLTGHSLRDCPCCDKGEMKIIATLLRIPQRKYFNSS